MRRLRLVLLAVLVALTAVPRPAAAEDVRARFQRLGLFLDVFEKTRSTYVESVSDWRLVEGAIAGMEKAAGVRTPTPAEAHARCDQRRADAYRPMMCLGALFTRLAAAAQDQADDKLVRGAIDGMLGALDVNSSYIDARAFADLSGDRPGPPFGGVGLEVKIEDGDLKVVTAFEDAPGARSGVRAGDVIVAIDGDAVRGLELAKAVEKLRGPLGSEARLEIMRNGARITLAVRREVINLNPVRVRALDDVIWIRVTQLNAATMDALKRAIAPVRAQVADARLKGYILDLRNNSGGLLDQSIALADAFLERGEIATLRARRPEAWQRFDAKPGDLAGGKALVVLINGGTASGCEIVAGALQDHKRATIVGTRSWGNGSIQTIFPLGADKGALRLTTSMFFTPSGRSIQDKGIAPDIEVLQDAPRPQKSTTKSAGEAPTGATGSGAQSYVPPDAKDDKALYFAVDLLRGVRKHPAFVPGPGARAAVPPRSEASPAGR